MQVSFGQGEAKKARASLNAGLIRTDQEPRGEAKATLRLFFYCFWSLKDYV